uniref:Uncharacterized protein n=1 Tax=Acrobeloides nanus TaxID=290746 RepID=A0A914C8K0_9BILA
MAIFGFDAGLETLREVVDNTGQLFQCDFVPCLDQLENRSNIAWHLSNRFFLASSVNFCLFWNLNAFSPRSSCRILRALLSDIPNFLPGFLPEFTLLVEFR